MLALIAANTSDAALLWAGARRGAGGLPADCTELSRNHDGTVTCTSCAKRLAGELSRMDPCRFCASSLEGERNIGPIRPSAVTVPCMRPWMVIPLSALDYNQSIARLLSPAYPACLLWGSPARMATLGWLR